MATGRALFAGVDTDGNNNLWITDGTSKGTHELKKVTGSAPSLAPSSITLLGGKAVFVGVDERVRHELWVTDGTSGGTFEIRPAKAYSLGLFSPFTDPDFEPGELLRRWAASFCSRATTPKATRTCG